MVSDEDRIISELEQKTTESMPYHLRFLSPGENWMKIGSQIAIGVNGYHSPLPNEPFVSLTSGHPGKLCMAGPYLVEKGIFDVAFVTPSWYAQSASHRNMLRALAVFPHPDVFSIAVSKELGIESLQDIPDKKPVLRIASAPLGFSHPGGWIFQALLDYLGVSVNQIEQWGGSIRTDLRHGAMEDAIKNDDINMIADESIGSWCRIAYDAEFKFLPIEGSVLHDLTKKTGAPGMKLNGQDFELPDLTVDALDFRGWLLYCRKSMPKEAAYHIVKSIDSRKAIIERLFLPDPDRPRTGLGKIHLENLCQNSYIPLHDGAKAYYQEKGCKI